MNGANGLAQIAQQVQAPTNIVAAIKHAADRSGVDFGFLLDKAKTESSFDPDAKTKTSSATGLFQFIEKTWLTMVREHGAKYGLEKYASAIDDKCCVDDGALRKEILELRKDPTIAAYMAAEFTKDNAQHLENSIRGDVGKTELYLAHFLGAGGAAKFLRHMEKNPNLSAAAVMPTEAAANPGVFYRGGKSLSLQQVYDRFAKKFDDNNLLTQGYVAPQPAAEFSLPQSPALAAVALALPQNAQAPKMNIPISGSMAALAAMPVKQVAQQTDLPMDMDAAMAALAPLRGQVTQENLAYMTQVAMEALHDAMPGFDRDDRLPRI